MAALFCGIDWADDHHDVAVVNEAGEGPGRDEGRERSNRRRCDDGSGVVRRNIGGPDAGGDRVLEGTVRRGAGRVGTDGRRDIDAHPVRARDETAEAVTPLGVGHRGWRRGSRTVLRSHRHVGDAGLTRVETRRAELRVRAGTGRPGRGRGAAARVDNLFGSERIARRGVRTRGCWPRARWSFASTHRATLTSRRP
jgi:hypothetical protein